MKFKIPFTISKDIEILKRKSKRFIRFTSPKKGKTDDYLSDTDLNINRRQYLSICYRSFLINFLVISVFSTTILGILGAKFFFVYGFGFSFLISVFVVAIQINYPRIYSSKKAREIEKNLISVLQDMLVQLNSGVPIFRILVNISESDYGEVSLEFEKMTREISTGLPQVEAIEKYGKRTTSKFFKRVLWQISNGMRAGSDMGIVIREGIISLSEEQSIQIQNYGGKLNPLVMFYMLMAVIIPSLGITFLIIISSLLNIPGEIVRLFFFGIFGAVTFMQIMFLGVIRSRRPSLL